jgi:hypothetical protein
MLRDVPKERNPLPDTRAPGSGKHRAKGTDEQVFRHTSELAPGRAYWLIVKNENFQTEVLASGLAGGKEAVPVFSHEEEAEMFLRLWEGGCDAWQARESSAGELVSVLYGLCADVERVALDPLPEMVLERTVGFVSLCRERFVDLVLGRERTPARRKG